MASANFHGARTGIRRTWVASFIAGCVLLALLAGALIGAAAAIPAVVIFPPPARVGPAHQVLLPLLGLLTVILLLVLLFRHGIDAAVAVLAVLAALALSLMIFFPGDISGPAVALVIGFGGLLGGVVLLAIAWAGGRDLAGRLHLFLLGVAAVAAAATLWELTVSFGEPEQFAPHITARVGAATAVSLLFLPLAIYLARHSMARDARFKLIRRVVVATLSRRSTSFRHADLSNADFAEARLGYCDLRQARLERTNWHGAQELDRALVAGGYLADDQVCRLVTTKQGAGQVYDELNLEGLNLQGADLAKASLIGANLSRATLADADLRATKLVRTQLQDTDLSGADLTGAYIEQWGVSNHTQFEGVRCAYVFMHLPVEDDPNPDPMRKPDDNGEEFQPGDFSDFIAPIIRTLEYYHGQHTDPRAVSRAAKTLDLMQRQENDAAIDPALSALAIQQLALRHPEAGMEVVALKAKDGDKVQIRTVVSDEAQRSRMSEEFRAIYTAMLALPNRKREQLLREIVEKDTQIGQLRSMVLAAVNNQSFYVETSIRPAGRVKCLLVAANPINETYLLLDVEQRQIMIKLRASEHRDVFELISVPAAQPDDLLQALNQHRPKVVQFSGHGAGSGELIFVDDQGHGVPVAVDVLRSLFAALQDDIRLVILNACYSEDQARAIVEVVDCVVGMSDAISDDAAITFIAAFYRALGFGRSIQNAVDQAVVGVGLLGTREETIPQLLTRAGVDANQIVLVAPDVLANEDRLPANKEGSYAVYRQGV